MGKNLTPNNLAGPPQEFGFGATGQISASETLPKTGRPNTPPAWRDRVGVWHRPVGRRQPWQLLGHLGSRAAANRMMYRLMGVASGDWTVAPADSPPRPPKLWPTRAAP
jgi:hypothetical protein